MKLTFGMMIILLITSL